jgi:hypothetical protein
MISRKLVKQIEANADKLAMDVVEAVKHDKRAESYHSMSDNKYHKLVYDLYKHLGSWLHSQTWHRLRTSYERKGRDRYHDGMPLDQLVFALTHTKTTLIDFVRGSMPGESDERDLELELLLAISAFFDRAIYHTVRGFEDARLSALKNPAPVKTKQRRRTAKEREMDAASELESSVSRSGDIGESSG